MDRVTAKRGKFMLFENLITYWQRIFNEISKEKKESTVSLLKSVTKAITKQSRYFTIKNYFCIPLHLSKMLKYTEKNNNIINAYIHSKYSLHSTTNF